MRFDFDEIEERFWYGDIAGSVDFRGNYGCLFAFILMEARKSDSNMIDVSFCYHHQFTSIGREEYYKALQWLQDKGLIQYFRGKNNTQKGRIVLLINKYQEVGNPTSECTSKVTDTGTSTPTDTHTSNPTGIHTTVYTGEATTAGIATHLTRTYAPAIGSINNNILSLTEREINNNPPPQNAHVHTCIREGAVESVEGCRDTLHPPVSQQNSPRNNGVAKKLPYNHFTQAYRNDDVRGEGVVLWDALSGREQQEVLKAIPGYLSTLDGDRIRYKKNPRKFLEERYWRGFIPNEPDPILKVQLSYEEAGAIHQLASHLRYRQGWEKQAAEIEARYRILQPETRPCE